ncbi:hypothetical protein [Singulisphaera sp. PoT]|uniref:hypothetical protein n=1 Tax=Singulisphaera sp. PoT TaxID=3411797 RepID=UPI003BF5F809
MSERYWLVHPNGGRQLIDPHQFDIVRLADQMTRIGGSLVIEELEPPTPPVATTPAPIPSPIVGQRLFEPPVSALGPLFRDRLDRIYTCKQPYTLEIKTRATTRVLGGYYRTRSLIRIYSHDGETGRRPLEELFDTFLHEMAHHLEYTEPDSFHAKACGRVPGRMHSRLFWRILGELKHRWAHLQARQSSC